MCGQLAYLPRDSFVMVYLSVMFFPVHTLAANFCAAQRTLRHVRAHERVRGHEPGRRWTTEGSKGHSVRTGHDGMAAGRSASQPLQVKFVLLQARPHRLTAHCVAAFRLPLAPQAASPATRPRPGSVTDSVTASEKPMQTWQPLVATLWPASSLLRILIPELFFSGRRRGNGHASETDDMMRCVSIVYVF